MNFMHYDACRAATMTPRPREIVSRRDEPGSGLPHTPLARGQPGPRWFALYSFAAVGTFQRRPAGSGASSGSSAASIAGIVERPRLSDILDSPMVRVCVVQGPSGAGKTTLLRSWTLQHEPAVAATWISVSSATGSRHAFWQHVVNNAKRLGDLTDDDARSLNEQLAVAADPIRVVIALLAGSEPATWVLDAYENLGELTSQVDDDLARLVAAVPSLRIMITTRAHTALAELDLRGEAVVRVITLSELALTTDEIHTLIARHAGIDDAELSRAIARSTRGYALAVRAAVLALSNLGRVPSVDSIEWNALLAAKLESLLPDPVAARFVADTSVPPYFDIELATRLTEHPDPAGLLSLLERNGFGRWIPYTRGRPVFQYVEAVRDVFHARASERHERFRRASGTTAGWLLDNDDLDQSLQFAIAAGDHRLGQLIFLQLLITNPDSYISDRYLAPLQQIPRRDLEEHPLLAFALGLALMANPVLRSEAPAAFAVSIESPAMPVDLSPDLDAFCSSAMRAVARRLTSAFRDSAEASLEAAALAEAIDPELRDQFGEQIGTVLRQVSYSLFQGGKTDDAIAAMNRSAALCTNQTSRNYSIAYAAGANAFAGDVAKAKALQLAVDTSAWPDEFKLSYMNGLGLVAEAFIRLDALDFAGASDILRESESYIQTAEFWPFLTAISMAARCGLGQGRAEAERVAAEMSASMPPPGVGDNVATEYLNSWLAHLWLESGDATHAARILDEQPDSSPHLASVRIEYLLHAGDDGRALELTQELLELPDHTLRTRAATQTIGAVAATRRRESSLALSLLNGAAVTYETYGPRLHVALLAPAHRRDLLEFARQSRSASLRRYLDIPASVRDVGRAPVGTLTARERVVLGALAEYGSTRAIAEALVVSRHTIKSQLQGIYRKLGVSSRDAALEVSREFNLLDAAPSPAHGD